MVAPATKAHAAPGSGRGRPGLPILPAALVVVGLFCGAACGAADTATVGQTSCEPRVCGANDCIPQPPDGAHLCAPGVCNYQTQTGCPAQATCGPKLDFANNTVAPACLQTGTRKRGEVCADQTNGGTVVPASLCLPGLYCLHSEGKPGFCRKLCCGESGASYGDWRACATAPGEQPESCVREIDAQFEVPPGSKMFETVKLNLFACVPVNNCDVLDKRSCKPGPDAGPDVDPERPVCRIADALGNVACMPKSNVGLGEPCQHLDQCGEVQTCAHTVDPQGIPLTGALTCRRLCRVGICGEQACPESEGTCVHFHRDPPGVGECTPLWPSNACYVPDGGAMPDAGRANAGPPNFCKPEDGGPERG